MELEFEVHDQEAGGTVTRKIGELILDISQ